MSAEHVLQIRPVPDAPSPEPIAPLLLTARDAARLLAISERSLWALTAPRGPLPAVRFGRSIRYSLAALQEFVRTAQKGGIA